MHDIERTCRGSKPRQKPFLRLAVDHLHNHINGDDCPLAILNIDDDSDSPWTDDDQCVAAMLVSRQDLHGTRDNCLDVFLRVLLCYQAMNLDGKRVGKWLWRARRLRLIVGSVIPNVEALHLAVIRNGFGPVDDKRRTGVEPIVNGPAKEKLDTINGRLGISNL